jgi:hypothetical protein
MTCLISGIDYTPAGLFLPHPHAAKRMFYREGAGKNRGGDMHILPPALFSLREYAILGWNFVTLVVSGG